jgi:hypothetical protein
MECGRARREGESPRSGHCTGSEWGSHLGHGRCASPGEQVPRSGVIQPSARFTLTGCSQRMLFRSELYLFLSLSRGHAHRIWLFRRKRHFCSQGGTECARKHRLPALTSSPRAADKPPDWQTDRQRQQPGGSFSVSSAAAPSRAWRTGSSPYTCTAPPRSD